MDAVELAVNAPYLAYLLLAEAIINMLDTYSATIDIAIWESLREGLNTKLCLEDDKREILSRR
jgi:hypothetical protein